jgi:hypothetical protein
MMINQTVCVGTIGEKTKIRRLLANENKVKAL